MRCHRGGRATLPPMFSSRWRAQGSSCAALDRRQGVRANRELATAHPRTSTFATEQALAKRSFRLLALSLALGGGRAVLAEWSRARAHLRQEVHERARQRVLLEPVVDVHAALLAP